MKKVGVGLIGCGFVAELHMYAGAGHAFNLDESNRISIIHWPDRLADWLAEQLDAAVGAAVQAGGRGTNGE